jgi:hypothetical protein
MGTFLFLRIFYLVIRGIQIDLLLFHFSHQEMKAPALATDPYVAFVAAQEIMAPKLARGPYVLWRASSIVCNMLAPSGRRLGASVAFFAPTVRPNVDAPLPLCRPSCLISVQFLSRPQEP